MRGEGTVSLGKKPAGSVRTSYTCGGGEAAFKAIMEFVAVEARRRSVCSGGWRGEARRCGDQRMLIEDEQLAELMRREQAVEKEKERLAALAITTIASKGAMAAGQQMPASS